MITKLIKGIKKDHSRCTVNSHELCLLVNIIHFNSTSNGRLIQSEWR